MQTIINQLDPKIFFRLLLSIVVIVLVIIYNIRYQLTIAKENAKVIASSRQPIKVKYYSYDTNNNGNYNYNNHNNNQNKFVNNDNNESFGSTSLYSHQENALHEASITWADFLEIKKQPPRSLQFKYNRDVALVTCAPNIVMNTTSKISKHDKNWCTWALSESGGKVKPGESYGILSTEEKQRFDYLHCDKIASGNDYSCDDGWGENFIRTWRRNIVPGLCEDNAMSKVRCFDSGFYGTRFCEFEHAMMDFKKMRQRSSSNSASSRLWERGFLSTDCGEMAKENIGYLQIYKPDIAGSSDAICDYVFNETVLAYSHDNVKSLGHMVSDFLNVWTMLWLTGTSRFTKDISFLTIDGIRNGQSNGDMPSHYFRHYDTSFRRVIRAASFGSSAKVCFKRLIMQPKPQIPYVKDGWLDDTRCSFLGPSAIFQRWNYHIRQAYGLLDPALLEATNREWSVLLITRPSRSASGSTVSGANDKNGNAVTTPSSHGGGTSTSRVIANQDEVVTALTDYAGTNGMRLTVLDITKLSFDEQVAVISQASIVIGMHGTGIASTIHMSIGTNYCCGVIELLPEKEFGRIHAFGNMARRLGAYHRRVIIPEQATQASGSTVNINALTAALDAMKLDIDHRSSCMLPSVLKNPYL